MNEEKGTTASETVMEEVAVSETAESAVEETLSPPRI